ncbi:MAG: MGMT family protein, partial [Phycisphaerae bacterium]|nr:MGMT family protein [Phycisphaerae bacterium]
MVLDRSERIVEKVKKALCDCPPLIPEGCIASYASVGQRLGLRARDVGRACFKLGKEYPATKIPYHRIVHKDGKLPKR